MTGEQSLRTTVRFGVFEADFRAGELRKRGVKIKLQEQPLQILQTLLEHPGEIVTREELQRKIWPTNTFVDFEQGLYNSIRRLRDALNDSPEKPRFIETLSRRGYRFIGTVTAAHRQIRSLAVLPLENLSDDHEQEYFAEGLTEALINSLAKIGELRVVSRTSAMQYKGVRRSLRDIAQDLGVEGIIEGTVLRVGERIRISTQLVDAYADTHLWAETYDRPLRDILAIHSDVAQAIAQQVQIKLTLYEHSHFAQKYAVDPQAYESYLKGRYYWNRRPAELGKAIYHFEQAIAKDSGHAASYAGLASCLNALTAFSIVSPNEGSDKAKKLAHRAIEIDNSLAEAHAALAFAIVYEYDFLSAERGFERAIQLDPSDATAHLVFGFYLGMMGRYEEAYTEVRRAIRLDPLPYFTAVLAFVCLYNRRYDQAIEQCLKTLELDPNSGAAWACLAWAQSCKLLHESAFASLQKAREFWPGATPLAWLGEMYAAAGYRDEAEKILGQLQDFPKERYVTTYGMSRIYAALGKPEGAFQWLETAYKERANQMVLLKVDPVFDGLRSDPRFQDLLRRMNFPP